MANLAEVAELLTIPVALALVYFVWRLNQKAAEDAAWRKEREAADATIETMVGDKHEIAMDEIKERHREVSARLDNLKEWRDQHQANCRDDHAEIRDEIKGLRADLNKDVGELKVNMAQIAAALQGASFAPPTPAGGAVTNWQQQGNAA